MADLFQDLLPDSQGEHEEVQNLFLDEAGDPTVFDSKGRSLIDTNGCSRFFMIGKLEAADPAGLAEKLMALRHKLLKDPYFAGVESFRPERGKTALLFHAKDDLPEVRYHVFNLLRSQGDDLRFHAVIRDKQAVLKEELKKRDANPSYRYNPNSLYDSVMTKLFAKLHRLADRYQVYIAKRGHKDRNHAIAAALNRAEAEFERNYGFSRGGEKARHIIISNPEVTVCLQAVDYFLWAVQRFYEPRLHPKTGETLQEDRFLNLLWSQIGEIYDADFGPTQGTHFTASNPLTLEDRFSEKKRRKID